MQTKTLTPEETDILDKFLVKNYQEFHQFTFNHALANTLPSWRAEMLATDEAFIDYVVKIQQHGI
jgi:hypothetical protein